MARNDLIRLEFEALIGFFEDRIIESFWSLSWDGVSESLCPEVPNATSVIPIYVFKFLGDDKALVLVCSNVILPSQVATLDWDTITLLVKAAEFDSYLDEIELVAAVDMIDLIDPIDPLIGVKPMPSKACVVCNGSGDVVGLFLWFQFGTHVGFVVGPVGAHAVLFGGAFDAAYANAKSHELHGDLKIIEKEFSHSSVDDLRTADDIDWFG